MAPTQYTLRFLPSCDPTVRERTEKAFARVDSTPTGRKRARKCAPLAPHGDKALSAPDSVPCALKVPWYVAITYLAESNERLAFIAGPMSGPAAEALAAQYEPSCYGNSRNATGALAATAYRAGFVPPTTARIVVLPSQHEIQVIGTGIDEITMADLRIAA